MTGEDVIFDVTVIGGGPGGTSAAIYASRGKLKVLVIDKDMGQGAMGGEHLIANFPGFPDPIKAEELLKRMRRQAENLGAEFVQDKIVYTDFRKDVKLVASPKNQYRSKSVILATGSMGSEPSLKGEGEFLGRGVAYCAICDGPYFEGKEVAVTGQVDRVREELELISGFASRIYFIPPAGKLSEKDLERLSEFGKVRVLKDRRVREITGTMKMEAVILEGPEGEERLEVEGIFVYLQGSRPVVEFIADKMEKGGNGCLSVKDDNMSTSLPGVFAVGDVTCRKVRQISLAVGEGCKAALAAEAFIKGKDKAFSQWGT
ncbi:MAG: NAD(P)/FAD-dependent oxidoreductase [Thermoplasmatota archaeon]